MKLSVPLLVATGQKYLDGGESNSKTVQNEPMY